MNILHIDSSIMDTESVSKKLTAAVVAQLKQQHTDAEVTYLDLDQNPVGHLSGTALMSPTAEQIALSDRLIEQYLNADVLVLGVPMYNFTVPSTLKAWFDHVLVARRTFRYTAEGVEGLAGDKKVYLVSSRGGVYGDEHALDFQEGFVRTALGFTGVTDIEVIRAEGVNLSPESKQQAISQAALQVDGLGLAAAV